MNRVRELVGASEIYRMGYDGTGIGVAVLDSGEPQHPDLNGRMVYNYNYISRNQNGTDDCGHGTHICGIIGGTGTASGGRYQGIAPGCHFVSLKVLDRMGNGNSKAVVEALHWLIEHGKEYDVRIVNISMGSTAPQYSEKSGLLEAVEEVWDAGFVVCAAAGNQGPDRSTITIPGTSPKVITVGSPGNGKATRQLFGEGSDVCLYLQAGCGSARGLYYLLQCSVAKARSRRLCHQIGYFYGNAGGGRRLGFTVVREKGADQ